MSEYISFDLTGVYYTGLNQDDKRPSYIHYMSVASNCYAISEMMYGPNRGNICRVSAGHAVGLAVWGIS